MGSVNDESYNVQTKSFQPNEKSEQCPLSIRTHIIIHFEDEPSLPVSIISITNSFQPFKDFALPDILPIF